MASPHDPWFVERVGIPSSISGMRFSIEERLAERFISDVPAAGLNLLVVFAAGAALFAYLPTWFVALWLAANLLGYGIFLLVLRALRRDPAPAARLPIWVNRFSWCSTYGAVCWAMLAIPLAWDLGSNIHMFLYVVLVGFGAGAAILNAIHVPTIDRAVWTVTIPIVLASGSHGDGPHLIIAGWMFMSGAFASFLGRRLNAGLVKAVAMEIEHQEMADALSAKNAELRALNEQLHMARHAADASNRAKSEFLANMSHELRTPLNAIIGFGEIMAAEMYGPMAHPRYREYSGDVVASGRHLLELINDILDLAKVESGMMTLNEVALSPADVIGGCVRLVEPLARVRAIRLESVPHEPLPGLVADESRLRQIGLNLLSNAIKFTNPGGAVRTEIAAEPGGGIVLTVSDTGIGMTAKEIDIALEPFRQVSGGFARSEEGTGLGLPLTRKLVELHGGRLEIASAPDRGTTVKVSFPPERTIHPAIGRPQVAQAG